jgi:hypothetical protein
VDDAGAVETLRLIGQMIANDHFDMHAGTGYRSAILKVARDLDGDGGPDVKRGVTT